MTRASRANVAHASRPPHTPTGAVRVGSIAHHVARRDDFHPVARPAAISLGHRPTFYTDQAYLLLEAYLLDFSGDLYGQVASVGFVERIRAEERFDSVEALVAAMHRDVEAARRLLEPRS